LNDVIVANIKVCLNVAGDIETFLVSDFSFVPPHFRWESY